MREESDLYSLPKVVVETWLITCYQDVDDEGYSYSTRKGDIYSELPSLSTIYLFLSYTDSFLTTSVHWLLSLVVDFRGSLCTSHRCWAGWAKPSKVASLEWAHKRRMGQRMLKLVLSIKTLTASARCIRRRTVRVDKITSGRSLKASVSIVESCEIPLWPLH